MDQTLKDAIFRAVACEPFARTLNMELVELDEGFSAVEMTYDPGTMDNMFGRAHGGSLFSLIDEAFEERVVKARHYFAQQLPRDLQRAVEFFDPQRYNEASSLLDNILFGKVVTGHAGAAERIGALLRRVERSKASQSRRRFGPIEIDADRHRVCPQGFA